jgi:hypothetical protein
MKKASEIINHILSPYSDKIQQKRCLKKIISLLPPKYNKYITSLQLKGEILFINVSHQAVKQELYFNRNLIFSIIKTMHSAGMCININPSKIITNYKYCPKPKPPEIYKFYIKPAGDFEIKAKKEEIRKKFEEIKALLKRN